jgi:hypothetical protein
MCPYPQIGIVISDPFQLYVGGGNKYTGDPGGHITYGVTIKSIKTPEEIKSRGLCDQWNLSTLLPNNSKNNLALMINDMMN